MFVGERKPITLTLKVFTNKKTNQLSVILPRKEIKRLIGDKDPRFLEINISKKKRL